MAMLFLILMSIPINTISIVINAAGVIRYGNPTNAIILALNLIYFGVLFTVVRKLRGRSDA